MQSNNTASHAVTAQRRTTTTLLITGCFFLSGLAGLIYEVVWARQLSLFLGITSYAHTAVITAYMAGLAAGSLYFGHRADQHTQPLKLYAWLEIGVGVYAAITPWLFTALQLGYVSLTDASQIGELSGHLTRFAIALLALLVPTFLMGGTLPLLVRGFITELPELGKITGRFYGINTLGAVLGTLLTGYLLLPTLGITATIFVGVAINLGIAIVVLLVLRKQDQTGGMVKPAVVFEEESTPVEPMSARLQYVLLIGFATAGFAALLTQLAWIRALILVVGGSVYAFTITLASFLAGIGLGSLLYTRYLAKPGGWLATSWLKGRMVQAALLALLISLTLLLGLPLIGKLPGWFLAGYAAGLKNNFPLFQLFIFALSFGLMILPTLLMGALLPLVTVIWTRSIGRAGHGVGAAYAINTSGTILGASMGGLFILPWLGVHDSIQLAAGLYFLVATAFWVISDGRVRQVNRYAVIGITALVLLTITWLIPPWNKILMVSGVFQTPDKMIGQMADNSLQDIVERNELAYYKEGLDGIVAVRRDGEDRSLVINGKADASSRNDLPTQIMLAQLPMALNRQTESALVIGLGSGITAGTLATSESLKNLTILEISSEVVEASAFFKPENYSVLDDPRTTLVTADARNYLMASSQHYDLIISEPSNPWISGIANLFTDEFIKLAKSRLNPNGVMTQWFHTYSMSDADLKTVLKTFDDNFQYVSVWAPLFEDLVIIGTDQPHALSLDHFQGRQAVKFTEQLRRGQVDSFHDLVKLYIFGGNALSSYVKHARINTDNNPVIEFSAPRNLYATTTRQNMANIFEYLAEQKQAVSVTGMVHQSSSYMDARFMGLKIASNKAVVADQVRPQWWVIHRLLKQNGERLYGIVETERSITWQEGIASYYVQANWFQTIPPEDNLLAMLNKLKHTSGRQGGMIKLAGDIDAIWLTGKANSQRQLDLAWRCPAQPSGFIHYALRATLPASGEDAQGDILNSLANRLHCY